MMEQGITDIFKCLVLDLDIFYTVKEQKISVILTFLEAGSRRCLTV